MAIQSVRLAAACAASLVVLSSAGTTITTTKVAVIGDTSFGSPNEFFGNLSVPPSISQTGIVGFKAVTRVTGTSVVFHGLFQWQAGVGTQVAKQGQPMADHPTYLYGTDFGIPTINSAGMYAVQASGNFANIAGMPGDFQLIGLANTQPNPDPNPQYPSGLSIMQPPMISDTGFVGFRASQGAAKQIWTGVPGDMQVAAQVGDQVSGLAQGALLSGIAFTHLTDSGAAVFTGSVNGGGFSNTSAIMKADSSGLQALFLPGQEAPGTNGGHFVGFGPPPSVNSSGVLGLSAVYTSQDGGSSNSGAWVGQADDLHMIAKQGDAAPGLADGYAFDSLQLSSPVVTHSGDAVLVAFAKKQGVPGSTTGIWTWDDGGLQLLTKAFDPVGNTTPGATWTSLSTGGAAALAVNDLHQVAFIGQMNVPGLGSTTGLMATDLNGDVQAIAVKNMPFLVAPGDLRTVADIDVAGSLISGPIVGLNGDDGNHSFFNDLGQVAFELRFTDGSYGIFVTNTVPAPSALGMMAMGIACASARRRRR